MDRSSWIKEKRRASLERMDREWAPVYDQNWGAMDPTHARFFKRFLGLCPPHSHILDSACGTGKYWPLILAGGHTVTGIDQSQGMLDQARAKFPAVPTERTGLQEMGYREAFEGAACVDAMESVFPEDWPPVLKNFFHALKPGGVLYFTVELLGEQEIADAFRAGQELGLPLVYGEWATEGRYHYYPRIEQVKEWVRAAGFGLVEEIEGEEYQHFLVQKLAE